MSSYQVSIPGNPPRKNRRHIIVGRRLINSKEFRAFTKALGEAWIAAGHPRIEAGIWSLTVHSTWPRTRHLDQPVPLGDVDAPVSCILDAMQAAGVLDDDARIMSLAASKSQGSNPSTIVTLSKI